MMRGLKAAGKLGAAVPIGFEFPFHIAAPESPSEVREATFKRGTSTNGMVDPPNPGIHARLAGPQADSRAIR
jgi:hypothetical protein